MRTSRRAIVVLSVGATALAVTVTVGMTGAHSATQDAAAPPSAAPSDDAARALPTTALLSSRVGDRVVRASRSLPRVGTNVRMRCPTTRKPGCKLSWIRHDAGRRIHPVYGYRSCHTGIDLRGRYGDKIRAAAAGRVIKVVHGDRAYGNFTLVQDNETVRTMYAHQSRIVVRPGQRVGFGQVIGYVGATGFASGPHLHFEVHVNKRPYDPDGWFGGTKRAIGCYPGLKY